MEPQAEPRISLQDPAKAVGEAAEAFQLLPPINLFRAMAAGKSLFPAYMRFLDLLFRPLELNSRTERLVILHVARRSGCDYAWKQNVLTARALGIREEQILALESGEVSAPSFTDEQAIALRFAEEAMDLIEVTDATFAKAKDYFSENAICELLYVVGAYMFIARFARTARVQLDRVDPEAALSATAEMLAKHGQPKLRS